MCTDSITISTTTYTLFHTDIYTHIYTNTHRGRDNLSDEAFKAPKEGNKGKKQVDYH